MAQPVGMADLVHGRVLLTLGAVVVHQPPVEFDLDLISCPQARIGRTAPSHDPIPASGIEPVKHVDLGVIGPILLLEVSGGRCRVPFRLRGLERRLVPVVDGVEAI